jgi:outer membrane lipoprotein SlyB
MHRSIHRSCAAAVVLAACLGAPAARAADAAPGEPRVVILCPECGTVYNIRRVEKPVAPERDVLPSIASSPQSGGIGNQTQAVPLFSLGRGGPQRVQREPATRSVWEMTVRYDNGQFGFVTQAAEPDLRVGDRVRHVENTLEPIPQPPR